MADGRWSVQLPALPPSLLPTTLNVSSSAADDAKLGFDDVLVGEMYVCSGQSNMGLQVQATVNASAYIAAAGERAASLRIAQVANAAEYYNVTTPQTDLALSIPWARPGPASPGFAWPARWSRRA